MKHTLLVGIIRPRVRVRIMVRVRRVSGWLIWLIKVLIITPIPKIATPRLRQEGTDLILLVTLSFPHLTLPFAFVG